MRARRLLAAVVAIAAAVLLSGCIQITSIQVTQPGIVGPLHVTHTVCVNFDAQGTDCPSVLQADLAGSAAQVFVAYRVPSWAPDPTDVSFKFSDQTVSFQRDPAYDQALVQSTPGLVRAGMRWVGFRSRATPSLTTGSSVSGQLDATFDLPDDIAASFSHFAVIGWRASDQSHLPTRPVVCGPVFGQGANPQNTLCVDGFWPRGGASDSDPTDDSNTVAPRNRLAMTPPPAPVDVIAGQRARVSFGIASSGVQAATLVPLSASTDVPGAAATAPVSLALGSSTPIAVDVDVPSSTPAGTYAVRLAAGATATERVAVGSIRVSAAVSAGSPTPAPTPTPGPAPTPTPGPSPATFAGSVSDAGGALGGDGARAQLRAGKFRIKVRAPGRGALSAQVRLGKSVLAQGTATAKRAGLTTVKLRLTKTGRSVLSGSAALSGSLRVAFAPRHGKHVTTSVDVTIAAG